jgi:hypothetical protein
MTLEEAGAVGTAAPVDGFEGTARFEAVDDSGAGDAARALASPPPQDAVQRKSIELTKLRFMAAAFSLLLGC